MKIIQRVWRSHNSTKMIALQLQQEWETLIHSHTVSISSTWISSSLLRPFLFFTTNLSSRYQKIQARDVDCMRNCFRILLESLNSTGKSCLFQLFGHTYRCGCRHPFCSSCWFQNQIFFKHITIYGNGWSSINMLTQKESRM